MKFKIKHWKLSVGTTETSRAYHERCQQSPDISKLAVLKYILLHWSVIDTNFKFPLQIGLSGTEIIHNIQTFHLVRAQKEICVRKWMKESMNRCQRNLSDISIRRHFASNELLQAFFQKIVQCKPPTYFQVQTLSNWNGLTDWGI